jgi:hypothetical protein
MATCEECGSRQMGPSIVDGESVEVCGLCGHLQGDAEAVRRVQDNRAAFERGLQPAVYPLVKALETVQSFSVDGASAGRPDRGEYPYVFIRVAAEGLKDVESLLKSLEMANRQTKRRWVVELSLQRGLLFILRPRFWKAILDISTQDILEARGDLPILARSIARDAQLGWWKA